MDGHVTIEVGGRTVSGDYTLDGNVLTVTLNGKSRQTSIDYGPLILVTRRLLRELALSEAHAIE